MIATKDLLNLEKLEDFSNCIYMLTAEPAYWPVVEHTHRLHLMIL